MFRYYFKNTNSSSYTEITDYISRDSLQVNDELQEKANTAVFAMESNPVSTGQEVKIFDTDKVTAIQNVNTHAISFSNATDHVKVDDDTSIQNIFNSGGSVSVWIYAEGAGGGSAARIITKGNWLLFINVSGGNARIDFFKVFSGNSGRWQTGYIVPLNTWTHVTVTYNASSVANDPIIYINGVSVSFTETSTPAGTATTDVGSDAYIGNSSALNRNWDGLIDELRLYNKILTTTEINNDYQRALGGKENGLVACFNFNNQVTERTNNINTTCSGTTFTTSVPFGVTSTFSGTKVDVDKTRHDVNKYRVGKNIWYNIGTIDESITTVSSVNTVSSYVVTTTASTMPLVNTYIGTKEFAGHVSKVRNKNLQQLKNVLYDVDCFDYTKEFDRRAINDSWTNFTAKQIIDEFVREVVNVGLTDTFTTSNVETGSVFAKASAPFENPVSLMQRLADQDGGFSWWIDYNRVINYKAFQSDVAPFSLNTISNNFNNLTITTDLTRTKNRQVFLGGLEDSLTYTNEFHKGDGSKREWVLRAKFSDLSIAVGTNSSSMSTASVLPDNLYEETAADYFSNYTMQSVRQAETTPTLDTTSLIRFTYKEKIPINVLDENPTSINALKALGFGDGVLEGRPITDKSIDSRAAAEDLTRAELLKFANPLLNASFVTEQRGLKSGQSIRITDNNRNVNQDFLIQRVSARSYAGDRFVYNVTCASTLFGLTELIQKLLKQGSKVELDSNIQIDLLKLLNEKVSMTSSWSREDENENDENISLTSSYISELKIPPFLWGETTSANAGIWDLSSWA
jgi:hypothetical protein